MQKLDKITMNAFENILVYFNSLFTDGIVFKETTPEHIDEIMPNIFLDDEIELLKEIKQEPKEFLLNSLNNSLYHFTVLYKNKVLLLFGVNKVMFEDKFVVWIYPDTKSKYKKKLTSVCKKSIKAVADIHGSVVAFEPKKSSLGLRWVQFVGGVVTGDITFNGTDFYIVSFAGG